MIEYVLFLIGILILIKGADFLVEGASTLAHRMRVPTLVIGLTLVAFGTSLPELIVNIFAAIKGSTDIAFGNIIGSNIANILLVLGIVAIISPIKVKRPTIWKEIPFCLLAVVVLFIASNYLLIDKINIISLTKVSGLIFLCFFVIFLYYTVNLAKKSKRQLDKEDVEIKTYSGRKIFLMVFAGLVCLYFGGKWIVDGAVLAAKQLGLSEFLISATILAIGTSLPEVITGITAARKKETGLAVGNVLGSNIFNIFWILGVTALIAPIAIPQFINMDMIFLGGATFLLFLFLFMGKKHELERWQGLAFILLYIFYIVFIVIRG